MTAMLQHDLNPIELASNFGRLLACCKNATPIAEVMANNHKRIVLPSDVGHKLPVYIFEMGVLSMKLRHVLMAGTAVLAFSGQAYADGHAKVISNPSKAAVTITGQIQRAFAYIDDGSSERVRHMEHGQSESGIDIKGTSCLLYTF